MSKYHNYVPQPLGFYKEMYTGDRQYQNYLQNQCKKDLSTWRFIIVAQSPGIDVGSPRLRIPPFQIKRDLGIGASVTSFKIRSIKGDIADTALSTGNFSIANLNDAGTLDTIIYNGTTQNLSIDSIPYGQFYFTVSDGTNNFYSEVFEVEAESSINNTFPQACGTQRFVGLSWSNSGCIISETIYNDAPSFWLLLPIDLGQPDYKYKPETADDGQGGIIKTFQRLEKRWQFFIVAPEYIADALASTQMMKDVSLSFEGGDSVICSDIEVSTSWIDPCFAKITFTFSADILAKTMCC